MKAMFVNSLNISNHQIQAASWIESIFQQLEHHMDIFFFSPQDTLYTTKRISGFLSGREVTIYECYSKSTRVEIGKIIRQEGIDIVIIFGTENKNSLEALNGCHDISFEKHTVVFAQGFCSVCATHYLEGVPKWVVLRYTIRDILRRDGLIDQVIKLRKKEGIENSILSNASHFIGRTTMDYALLKMHNPYASYYKCNDIMRNGFYNYTWKLDKCNKHSIFVSQYYYPIKGFHFLIEAINILKKKYPDLTVYAAGYNPIIKGIDKNEIKDSSYIRYLKDLIVKYSLHNQIFFTGQLSEQEMIQHYLKCNVFVMPSTIENSPNSLAEAMLLGVPTIASYVGGIPDFATHLNDAFLYPSTDINLLAYYIDKVFSDDDLAVTLGKNARIRGQHEYDLENNKKTLLKTFNYIASCDELTQSRGSSLVCRDKSVGTKKKTL